MTEFEEINERILGFESSKENFLMSTKINDFSLFPIIRWEILSSTKRRLASEQAPHFNVRQGTQLKLNFMKNLFYNIRSFLSVGSVDLLVFSNSNLRRRKVKGQYYDVIYDPLIDFIGEESLIVENSLHGIHRIPQYTKSVLFRETMRLVTELVRLENIVSLTYKITEYLKILKSEPLLSEIDIDQLRKVIINSLKYQKTISKLLIKTSPKLVLFHCGSYGGATSLIIKTCKDMGITTAEFQHGYVGKSHLAYNYSLKGEEYSSYLPDYYLTYGQYWKDQLIRFPNQTVVIGNPELKFQLSERQNMTSRDEVLIVSQGTVTSRLVELTKELRKKLPNKITIVYRLHPGEVPFEERYNSLYSIDGIIVDKNSNIFDLIKRSKAVVGFNSTTLFEALPFEKPIYVMKDSASDAYIPKEVGKRFSSADELADLILSNSVDHHDDDWKYYWELDWEPRFKDFLSMIGLK